MTSTTAAHTDQAVHRHEEVAPPPDDPRKPDSPTDIERRSWKYILLKSVREFGRDQCTDLAAGLTYYGTLAVFPAVIALVSILGVVGQADETVDEVMSFLDPFVSASAADLVRGVIDNIASSEAAGLALVIGLLTALYSASGYLNAFSRAMNRIYQIREGRSFVRLKMTMFAVTLVEVLLVAGILVLLVVSGPIAERIGETVGLGQQTVQIFNIAKWPAMILLVIVVVAILYFATPNVQQPKFRWVSVGAAVAIGIWILAAAGFSFYISGFSNYNATYGSLAGVIVALLFFYLTNVALLFGAELDAELERGRELQAGLAAERMLLLPARDTAGIEKMDAQIAAEVSDGRALREQAAKRLGLDPVVTDVPGGTSAGPADPDGRHGPVGKVMAGAALLVGFAMGLRAASKD